ncbi:DNA polymerase family A [Ascodesmis nigricans]|uniref:DNA-directed DNA polymerase n=1 Tax=Ascodesmis nigricans TaxID=341454 RepID=A0A4S2N7V6_9PEZI|nr:DNA polymerase family A [Ascodesmis nigricans]
MLLTVRPARPPWGYHLGTSLYRSPSPIRPRISLLLHQRHSFASTTDPATADEQPTPAATLAVPCEGRVNEIGVQQLSSHMYKQLFKRPSTPPEPYLVNLAKDHLERHQLLGKISDTSAPIGFDIPELHGETLDEHFHKLGIEASEPYLTNAKNFANSTLPPLPKRWDVKNSKGKYEFHSGWTKYNLNGTAEVGVAPDAEELMVFDVEVLYKHNPFAVMACAGTPNGWYCWISPWIMGETENPRQLVPLGDPTKDRIVIGHNVGYDRARIKEEYNIKQTRNFFLDTMSLHVAVNGMCSQQRPTWLKHAKNRALREQMAAETESLELANLLEHGQFMEEEEELWVGRSSINSLRDVAKFHCNIEVDKKIRDQFGELDRQGVKDQLADLLDYCALDVEITHKVFKQILPRFLEVCPHPVSFGALRHISSVMLPTSKKWEDYISSAESKYQELMEGVTTRLHDLAKLALESKDQPEVYLNDPWLKQLDWTGMEVKMTKGTKKEPPRPVANQKMPGFPKWYKELFKKVGGENILNLTVRQRVAPILLRLTWDGSPLIWSDVHGWCFRIPQEEVGKYKESAVVQVSMSEEENYSLKDDTAHAYFKLPHKDGPVSRVVNPMAKGYLQYFEAGTLGSEYALAKEALEMNAACSYWISARKRIMSQMVIYESDVESMGMEYLHNTENPESETENPESETENKDATSAESTEFGLILPQIIPMGTITRRAVEATWLTASNAKKNRVGSELKAMISAPKGYSLVGADVDSEELWIASLVGDAQFKIHGGNAIGFMTLEGSKNAGTDLHSRTASILGISRNHAKIFNYGRIYGAGLKFAATLLRQFNPGMTDAKAAEIAGNLYHATKGTKTTEKVLSPKAFWRGGTESFVFNTLEEFAEQERPRTPVLAAGITEALMKKYIKKGGYLTSRINWAIQSSGVDYLHLLIISMDYLIRLYSIDARLAITVHDEIRYLVKDSDRYRAAMALQVANIWTRCMFAQQIGINDLPQSCAFFSAVDIDSVLRKEVNLDCITPSHPTPIPHGESLDILELLKRPEAELKNPDRSRIPIKIEDIPYEERTPVMHTLPKMEEVFLKAQIVSDERELKGVVKEARMKLFEQKGVSAAKGRRNNGKVRLSMDEFNKYYQEVERMELEMMEMEMESRAFPKGQGKGKGAKESVAGKTANVAKPPLRQTGYGARVEA